MGLPGSGKSSVARLVAERLQLRLVDLDEEIETRAGSSIASIFAGPGGERLFRALELEATRLLAASGEPAVVAPGGGWMANAEALALLRPHSRIIHLRVSPELAAARLGSGAALRPLLREIPGGAGATDAAGALRRLLEGREAAYRRADFDVDTELLDIQGVANEVVRLAGAGGPIGR